MPHAVAVPSAGFQALILCGPGASLNTFTSTPEEFPKALVPIANRPMLWYPLDWCYRMGITKIYIITPQTSSKAIEAALSHDPHLLTLPLPKAELLAPESLLQTSGTAEILRDPNVQAAITGDFLILPCDLICEIPGESLLEAWMTQQPGLGIATSSSLEHHRPKTSFGGDKCGRRGALGVWFETKAESSAKGAETDFVITTALPEPTVSPPESSLRPHISKLVYATTTDTLRDTIKEKKGFPIRQGLIRKHSRIRMLTTHRDAHVYIFPHWILETVSRNEHFDSISEDVIGWWAKATWQDGLAEKLGLRQIFEKSSSSSYPEGKDEVSSNKRKQNGLDEISPASMSTTLTSLLLPCGQTSNQTTPTVPPILAYIHPSSTLPSPTQLIRRVDTTSLLLTTSLYLATIAPATIPYSHPLKISTPSLISSRTTVHAPTTLLAPNVTVATHASIKECVIGASCSIGAGAKLVRCLLMDGVEVGEKCVLAGCVIGKGARVGQSAVLRDVEVQGGFVVEAEVVVEGEKMMVFEGLDEEGRGDGDEMVPRSPG